MSDPYKHPKWQKKRLKILERDQWSCVSCSASDATLHVHHFYYDGNPWDVEDKFLQTLCEKCHNALGKHPKGGVWWVLDDAKRPGVFVHWCPICAHHSFADAKNGIACAKCGWSTERYLSEKLHVVHGPLVKIAGMTYEAAKKSQKSWMWLKGCITRCRDAGMTDADLFGMCFPGVAIPDGLLGSHGFPSDGDDASGLWKATARSVNGLARDFCEIAREARWCAREIVEVTMPPGSMAAVSFLMRPEVRCEIEKEMTRISGRNVRFEMWIQSRLNVVSPHKQLEQFGQY